ncbi:ribonuclease II [Comamonas serinivorans]|uniref:Ribonuclease II n=1 Tax=Comamonas serinivorans TaxID=1082851 RepID=A0A1Y0EK13_9BURK|nr:RNB domain-containing ribonuclease [Comamonas serinivorans]ARU03800.1 ribonuclease II [Comamonas serinivorans]
MNVLFDEAGKFLAGRILSEAEASAQVELDSGKRVKVKSANQLLRFDKPGPGELIAQAQQLVPSIELALAWEFAPDDEFGFADLAADYFGDAPSLAQQVAALFALHEAPHYFRRAGKGRFKKAPAEIVQQALAAIEKKARIQAEIDTWAQQLAQGQCPEPVATQLYKILFRPDKNAPEYKAVVQAAKATQKPPLTLLQAAGAISSPYQFHWQRFLFEHFPKGTGFPPLSAPAITDTLPLASVQAYSIDDSSTTEIDDALSVQGLGSGTVTVGVHIAAPGLAFGPDSPLDAVARQRLSTVYMPGYKITMLPDEVVEAYTLGEGVPRPAISLYVTFDEASLAITGQRTLLEQVPIYANLRHDKLGGVVTPEWLETDSPTVAPHLDEATLARLTHLRPELSFLHRLARHLKAQREQVRGKPENFNRPDYSFKLVGQNPDADDAVPTGDETVQISVRPRGEALDLIVSEAMILANSTWGTWLGELGVPGIYRSQASMAPGVKVRMGTKALPHAGIGVKSYAWSTSPLRRYVDLVNQWQLIAAARHGATAALAAPFKPKDASLFSIVSSFDTAYSAYNGNQAQMERFWTLRHLQQAGLTELTGAVIKDLPGGAWLVRADDLPLVFPVMGSQLLARGAHVRVALGQVDLISLDVNGTVLERLDDVVTSADEDEDEDAPQAGPLHIAMDVNEAEGADTPAPTPS